VPAAQVHTPETHALSHLLPQPPQLRAFVERSTQLPSHRTAPGAQLHTPDTHEPAPHDRPHSPQWFGSVASEVQVPPHATAPAGHAMPVHTPLEHV
jgi:hypothetical protein